ncbi:transcriptional regulator [Burkholderia cepacia]|nr:helix-turn-helix domain-containing protein [Burkholderia cepacia]RQT81843.1 transcriptional regulator [Burkholderia cepacia]RQU01352.1 transcriptional regulator [Burkholderia cepacia]RQZ78016.1 transcriptional regulator [Burkholderia cepacia]
MTSSVSTYPCSVAATVDVAGGKWKPLIVHYLLGGTKRFGELRGLIGAVTQRSLTLQLRELESDGIVTRTVFAEVPPRVEYTLTEFGRTLAPVLDAMKQMGRCLPRATGAIRRAPAVFVRFPLRRGGWPDTVARRVVENAHVP